MHILGNSVSPAITVACAASAAVCLHYVAIWCQIAAALNKRKRLMADHCAEYEKHKPHRVVKAKPSAKISEPFITTTVTRWYE
jgi:hypothetical protein